jgi:SpoVK/Ycf46/Vps4 family AAA+-type ATPase
MAHVDEIIAAMRNRPRGVAALFTGPSGTGKTKAAEAIAADLGVPLHRVDVSKVISKYIGETEKHLQRLFDAAETAGAVLFFDEADALFGKRTDVKDSHDRYANLDVSYLLQRIERFKGLVILASNTKSNIDSAFARRLRYIIDFKD